MGSNLCGTHEEETETPRMTAEGFRADELPAKMVPDVSTQRIDFPAQDKVSPSTANKFRTCTNPFEYYLEDCEHPPIQADGPEEQVVAAPLPFGGRKINEAGQLPA